MICFLCLCLCLCLGKDSSNYSHFPFLVQGRALQTLPSTCQPLYGGGSSQGGQWDEGEPLTPPGRILQPASLGSSAHWDSQPRWAVLWRVCLGI